MKFQPEKHERLPLMKTDFRTELILPGRMDFLPLAYARELGGFGEAHSQGDQFHGGW